MGGNLCCRYFLLAARPDFLTPICCQYFGWLAAQADSFVSDQAPFLRFFGQIQIVFDAEQSCRIRDSHTLSAARVVVLRSPSSFCWASSVRTRTHCCATQGRGRFDAAGWSPYPKRAARLLLHPNVSDDLPSGARVHRAREGLASSCRQASGIITRHRWCLVAHHGGILSNLAARTERTRSNE